ncbi:MAG: dTDP-4-dehydrorhamnose 3,5-epimerase [Cyanobacteria bacterium K_DeepCast_35m_m2_023]|nr:dTDP-4-dehydrorhamnose 3,5-epimerase [Cyanobacteria bacterium K_DeepCast_35m_m2_023]
MQVDTLSTPSGQLLEGPLLLTPHRFDDARGWFVESWNQRCFDAAVGAEVRFVQDNQSCSQQGVLRGLHYQLPPEPQAKLVRCVVGAIFDVAVDLRRGSATFGHWVGAILDDQQHQQLWLPVGFAHGFLTLSPSAEVLYKASGYWNPSCERAIRWDDPALAIGWPMDQLVASPSPSPDWPRLAAKDAAAPSLAEALAAGDVFP